MPPARNKIPGQRNRGRPSTATASTTNPSYHIQRIFGLPPNNTGVYFDPVSSDPPGAFTLSPSPPPPLAALKDADLPTLPIGVYDVPLLRVPEDPLLSFAAAKLDRRFARDLGVRLSRARGETIPACCEHERGGASEERNRRRYVSFSLFSIHRI